MTLIRWQPKSEIDLFREEMSRLFDWALDRRGADLLDRGWVPPVDVRQESDRFLVRVDLPGMKRDDIQISQDGDTLIIQGKKKAERHSENETAFREERVFGSFMRSLVLPTSVDADRVEAIYSDGVLEVIVPKSESTRPKQIKIQS
jgi:HSP20 family protein